MNKASYSALLGRTAEFLKSRDDFAIVCHINPDGDAYGSACALAGVLEKLGKCCSIVCGSEIPQSYGFVAAGLRLGCREVKTVVAVDIASVAQWGSAWQTFGRCDLAIDHHFSHEKYSALEFVNPDAAATAVMIVELAEKLGVKIEKNTADAVFTALTTDTGCFKYTNTNVEAFETAIKMMKAGADTVKINRLMFETKTRSEMELWRLILDGIEYKCGGRVAICTVTQNMRRKSGFYNDDLGELASIPRQIEGVIYGITLKQQKRGLYKISIRTNAGGSARALAQKFGGGGHENASGCTVKGTMAEVKNALVAGAAEIAGWTE